MAFGLSFGKKKNKTTGTSEIDKTETTSQQQTGTNTSTGTTNQSTSQQSSGSTTGQQTSSQTGTNKTTGTTTGQTTQTTSAFSDPVLQSIESAVQGLFQTVGGGPAISNFDADSFIEGGVNSASSDINMDLESGLNQLVSGTGGTAGSNSAVALLSNRLRGDAAAKVAGVRSDLTGQAEQIQRDNALASSQIASVDQGFLGNLLSALKGGTVTTTGTESTTSAQDQQTQNTGTTNTAEQTAAQQSAQSTQTQQLIEMMSQLLQGTTNTVGTENMTQTNKSSGGGFSLGL